ncbi:GNAT family N-acetyltransferase [Neobacillus terrae]|uniref:GNAT family N-acetyltransferase n=1 Tax=Neobacillus terrae TaxID=3034837 RepID=UPI0014078567|nr:GNAT family N-acetyltransferase [Neobacillus terrae]NHM32869.1 GNAT family N-acetyltransferase [Neobacillus terrae]
MIIRNARENELTFIREQRVHSYKEHSKNLPLEHWEALKKAISSEADIQPGVELIVAEWEGKVTGSVALFPAETDAYEGAVELLDYPEIRMLAVSPDTRGRGVATALVSECIRRAKAQGCTAIGLHTGQFMEMAIHLYERIGFERQPEFDFEPANDGIIVRAYKLELT